jgi:aspartyl aminopeptidase
MVGGSTIGPSLSTNTGIKCIDVGVGVLGMHSINETCGVLDTFYYKSLFEAFFREYELIPHDLLKY